MGISPYWPREVRWSVAPFQNIGHAYQIIHSWLYLSSMFDGCAHSLHPLFPKTIFFTLNECFTHCFLCVCVCWTLTAYVLLYVCPLANSKVEDNWGKSRSGPLAQCKAAHVSSLLYNLACWLPLNPQQRLNQAYQEQPSHCCHTTWSCDYSTVRPVSRPLKAVCLNHSTLSAIHW